MYKKIMAKESINTLINRFEQKCTGPVQLSKEWFELRERGSRKRGRIGGSDIASLLECNPYRSRKELIREKMGIKKRKFGNQFPMLFGTIFEEVAVLCFEKSFNTKVFCKNISIVDPKGYDYMIFSPDGLCALPMVDDQIYLHYDDDDYKELTQFSPVLIEIKCPTKRDLARNGQILQYYYPQVQAGMLAIDIAHSGLFIDNQFRVCSYQQLCYDDGINCEERYSIHHYCRPLDEGATPIHVGVILVYGDLPQSINKQYLRVEEIGGRRLYDFGNATKRTFTDLLEHCRKDSLELKYLIPQESACELDVAEEIRQSDEKLLGMISWKLFDVTYTRINKNLEFIQNIALELDRYHTGTYDVKEDVVMEPVELPKKTMYLPPTVDLSFDSD